MGKTLVRVALAAFLAISSVPFVSRPSVAASCAATGVPTRTIYLPNITKTLGGPAGWVTPFIVQNVGVAPTDLEISFYRFSDGGLVTCRRISGLAPYRSFADVPNNDVDLPADSQFAVVVRSYGAEVISVVNEHQGAGATAEALSYVGLARGAQTQALPYVAKFASGWLVTFVMQNLGVANANVTARFVSFDGSKTATLTRVIAPGRSQFVNPVAEPSLATGTEYSVMLTSDQPIAAIANAHNDLPGSAAPMGFSYNAVASLSTEVMYVPSVARNADGVGRTTRVVVQNTGAFDAAPTLVFRRPGAPSVTVNVPTAIRAGRSWAFDPRLFADGITPCPATGAANCVGEGDWSLTVSGGQFAVLAIATTSATALGSVGIAAPGNRAYLPNVTRTLGGGLGWTTPIVLQSAGATSATLRWYRFVDGVLVLRQTVALSNGLAIRIDPRAVGGLADDTQYAVVVDAQGGDVAASVVELSFLGGDGAMAYEGFGATVATTPTATMISLAADRTSVYTGARVQANAVVKDQFDQPMNVGVTWSVTPSALGTVSSTGVYVASETATGVASVTASAAGLSSSVAISVAERPTAFVGGISFQVDASGLADVHTESPIRDTDASTIAVQVDLDVVAIQADYGRAFATRPRLYVLGSTQTYAGALQTILGLDAARAQQLASTSAGLYSPSVNAIAIDWSKVRDIVPLTTARHELTHMMEEQIAGGASMPAWFNEGNARWEELTVAGSQYIAMNGRYATASMAATGTLFSLSDLSSQSTWNARSGLAGTYQYHEAQEAVRL
ncbi:MAG TPA: hypothetical protein VFV20_11160, partial [Candidatus Limnocylindria bacterium]|nr:hypothetical protein [Candidatus Limnocylindria bacterium]